ncbi:hypothetical protein [Ralstonia sp. ASV6]|uniref:hypothetical protein n=1 Tax=Ralstonia sp. ASV6 TaxID=2795124 RepID=UPI0018EE2D3C|nr:hypothetical protein [Ralstonia sp. ASV6]
MAVKFVFLRCNRAGRLPTAIALFSRIKAVIPTVEVLGTLLASGSASAWCALVLDSCRTTDTLRATVL